MFSRIKDKLGTAGLVVAVVALVAALAGTAFAALPGLNSKQKKEVTKIAKKSGKPGPAGPQGAPGAPGPKGDTGPAGAAGKDGAPGKDGENGTDGKNGTDGENGFCSISVPECVLPSGATLTGNWAASGPGLSEPGTECAAGCQVVTAISYPLRVPGVSENIQYVEGTTENCPGTPSEPDAAPGFVCVYVAPSFGTSEPSFGSTKDYTSGLVMRFEHQNVESELRASGTWAVTAP
jgi:hypothetical protein